MARLDRRSRVALDEAYRYYRSLERENKKPELYNLVNSLNTLSCALSADYCDEFKLTRQLWRRLYQALFDRLITNFAGKVTVFNEAGGQMTPRAALPDNGSIQFIADGCRRAGDMLQISVNQLFPQTLHCVEKQWLEGQSVLTPENFKNNHECEDGFCPMQPMVLGQEVLSREATKAKEEAHHKWWDCYWQAYCAPDKGMEQLFRKQMAELEAVWGNLYY